MYGINWNRLFGWSVVSAVVLAYAAVPMAIAAGEAAEPITFHHDGGWCWYQDERAIVVDNTLIFGTIANGHNPDGSPNADRRGHIEITSYDLAAGKPIGTFLLHANYQPDDHNSPALLVRGDGRLLAMYCKHHRGAEIMYRISTKPGDAMDWQAVKTFAPSEKSQVTYSNLFRLAAERDGKGRIYDFFRGYDNSFEPSWMVSDDEGETWTAGGVLITEPGRERPYAKYASNGTDTIHFVFTDGHPRNCLNSIYHAYYRDGKVHTSDGKVIRALADGPITPAEATRIFEGGKNRVAWTSDLHLDPKGHPVAAYTLHRKPDFENDHRYRYARWDGSQWHDFEIAHAGTWLYEKEADYTGNIAIDPDDVNTVFISTDAHPTSGEPLISTADGQRHYELFRGVTADGGKTWTWTPVTANSPCDNIRPIVPKWNVAKTVVLWLRGKLDTYTKYDLDVVGKVFEASAAKVFEPVPDTSGAGFVPLFDGETLDGWRPVNGGAKYHVDDGCVVGVCDPASKMNTFLRTDKLYSDFILAFEVKFDVLGNSGVQFRSAQKNGDGRVFGYQCEIDGNPKRAWSGGIYDESRRGWLNNLDGDVHAAARAAFHFDDWNTFVIKANGRRLQTWVNGVPCADYVDTDPEHFTPSGFIGLQVHAGKQGQIRWRDIRIKELGSANP